MTASAEEVPFELIDRLVSMDFGGRGIGSLYAPARALVDDADIARGLGELVDAMLPRA